MHINELSGAIVDSAWTVYRTLGPGLFESVYESALSHELTKRGIPHNRQVSIPVIYDNTILQNAFHADLIVNDTIIVELKAIEDTTALHRAQLLTYLRLSGKPLANKLPTETDPPLTSTTSA